MRIRNGEIEPAADLDHLRIEYADRERRLERSDLYSPFNPANQFILQARARETLKLLREQGISDLKDQRILELGCGKGGVLQEYLGYGAQAKRLHGTDLLPHRVREAHKNLPHLPLTIADGQNLPFADSRFDLVLQYTVFTSVLVSQVKANLAREMLRVLKPGGLIVWYDFWLNPTNRQTRGIRPAEIRGLFPGCQFDFRRITLAPPIARRVVPLSWMLAYVLEKVKIFNSHYLVGIRRVVD